MGRDKFNPIFAAATSVHVDKKVNEIMVNSGISWEKGGRLASKIWHTLCYFK